MTITRSRDLDPGVAAVKRAVQRTVDQVGPGLFGVACSGGADSMTLAHATIAVAGAPHVVVLAIDHQLSAGSARVTAEVVAWANACGAAAVMRAIEVPQTPSLEAAARDARYAALAELADELGLTAVLVGHTARDQAETVLMRVLRGTGPAGLAGIPARRGLFLRPLLALPRDAIDAYVRHHELPTWDDPMNADSSLLRVRVRRELLPSLRRENPRLDAALCRLAGSATEWLELIDGLASPFGHLPIDCAILANQPVAVRKRAISIALEAEGVDYDTSHLEAVDDLVVRSRQGQVAIDLPGARLVRTYDQLALEQHTTLLDLQPPEGPYELRAWRAGDRMRPARLKGRSRKLSDLFIDAKVARDRRTTARVLVRTTDDVIVWTEHLGLAHGEGENLVPKPA